ncbi:unnamed protein product [Urochloa humidicola]
MGRPMCSTTEKPNTIVETEGIERTHTVRQPEPATKQGADEVTGGGQRIYLEGLAVTASLAELLDDALELNGTEVVPGPRRPQFDLRHQERARVAQWPQRGLQARWPRRPLLFGIAARRGSGGARWGCKDPAAAAAVETEQAAGCGEEGGRAASGGQTERQRERVGSRGFRSARFVA